MRLQQRLLLVFLPLTIVPILALMLTQLSLTRNYLLHSHSELVLLQTATVKEDFNNRYQQFQQVQFDNVPFFRRQFLEQVALRFQGDNPNQRGLVIYDPLGNWVLGPSVSDRHHFSDSELERLQPLIDSGQAQPMPGWFIHAEHQTYTLAGFQHAASGLTVLLYDNQAQILSPLTQSALVAFALAGVTLLLGIAIIALAAHLLSTPIVQLTQTVTQFGSGNTHLRSPLRLDGEVGILAHEFNRMAERLESFTQALESKIAERTQELHLRIDELHTTQKHLVESEKLAALGSMVAGIAHELNTPIGNAVTVSSSLVECRRRFDQLLQTGLTRSALEELLDDMQEGSQIIERNLERAAALIRSFKQLAVDQTSDQRRVFALAEMIDELLLSMRPTLRRSPVQLSLQIQEPLVLDSYPGALGQVLMNLINNALVHAFYNPKGPSQPGQIRLSAQAEPNIGLRLSVEDNGQGMTSEQLKRIFDPFYTTKLGQGGSGLGLHICYSLVTGLLGGKIEVTSTPGQGSRFDLYLPLNAPTSKHSVLDE